jgi:2'-5' RNA ligase
MFGCNGGGQYNCFAVVGYVPQPLAGFIDRLRRDLEPDSPARAHVTLLPPRSLTCSSEDAWRQLRDNLKDQPAIRVELQQVKIFQPTEVIYLSIGSGFEELERVHRKLDYGLCRFDEVWCYCPHITLARPSESNGLPAKFELASRRWSEFRHPRDFLLEEVTFVQNTWGDHWIDLEHYRLAPELVEERVE